MAVIFMEQTETGSAAWLSAVAGLSASTAQVAGAWSTYSLRAAGTAGTALWTSAVGEFYGQMRMRWNSVVGASSNLVVFQSPNAAENLRLGDAGGQLTVSRGGTVLGTGTQVINAGRWYYIQFRMIISDTVGVVTVKLDGTTKISLTSQDTRADTASGGDTCDRMTFDDGGGSDIYYDDVIINDTTDTDNVSYPDNLGIEALMPNAAGDQTGLSRGGTDSGVNYGQVDERGPNDATDYVFDTVVDDYDLYNLPATQWSDVAAVALCLRGQKDDAGVSIAHMIKVDTDASGSADTENQGADVGLSTGWAYATKIYNRQPGPSSWSAAKVNALQAGVKVR